MDDSEFMSVAHVETTPSVRVRFHPSAVRRGEWFEVVADVACLPLSLVNVYFCGRARARDRQWVLVDAGVFGSAGAIRRAAAERFGPDSRPAAIILTHGHFDHIGALPQLADEWHAPIYAHQLEMPYLTGESSYPPPDPAVGGGAMSLLSRLYPRGPVYLGDRVKPLPADGTIPGMPEWFWIPTPGHTAGHVSLFRDRDRFLIAGDAFVTTRQESVLSVLSMRQEVWRPPAYYTSDWTAAQHSVEMLAALEPEVAATGHGIPMWGSALREQLANLVEHWPTAALPRQGRYVMQPAITNQHGVVTVPEPVPDRQLAMLAIGGIAALAGFALLGSSRRRRRSWWRR